MKKELEEKLVRDYPEILQEYHLTPFESCMGRGFECGDGWYNLIDECCDQIRAFAEEDKINIIFEQVKEKLGRLTIYVKVEGDKEQKKIAYQIADAFAVKSQYVCDECGREFEDKITENIDGWISATCEDCRREV